MLCQVGVLVFLLWLRAEGLDADIWLKQEKQVIDLCQLGSVLKLSLLVFILSAASEPTVLTRPWSISSARMISEDLATWV